MSLTVGMVVPFQGPGGIYGPSAEAVTDLAVSEINAEGGILGRELQVTYVDGGAPLRQVRAQVAELLLSGSIDAIGGWHISSVRQAIAPLARGRAPYIYPAVYEGGENRSGLYCTGEVPEEQIQPALSWLKENLGVRRWFVIGDDYVWPRVTLARLRPRLRELGLELQGQRFLNMNRATPEAELRATAATIERSGADAVLMLMVGQNAARFNRTFAELGLSEQITRFSPLMEENTLLASGAAGTRNLYSSGGYFRSLATADALDLGSRYTATHGVAAPPLNAPAESCYESLLALRAILERAGSTSVEATDRSVDGTVFEGPRGPVQFSANHVRQTQYLAAAHDFDFTIIDSL